jgi:hypothetical protein
MLQSRFVRGLQLQSQNFHTINKVHVIGYLFGGTPYNGQRTNLTLTCSNVKTYIPEIFKVNYRRLVKRHNLVIYNTRDNITCSAVLS